MGAVHFLCQYPSLHFPLIEAPFWMVMNSKLNSFSRFLQFHDLVQQKLTIGLLMWALKGKSQGWDVAE